MKQVKDDPMPEEIVKGGSGGSAGAFIIAMILWIIILFILDAK